MGQLLILVWRWTATMESIQRMVVPGLLITRLCGSFISPAVAHQLMTTTPPGAASQVAIWSYRVYQLFAPR